MGSHNIRVGIADAKASVLVVVGVAVLGIERIWLGSAVSGNGKVRRDKSVDVLIELGDTAFDAVVLGEIWKDGDEGLLNVHITITFFRFVEIIFGVERLEIEIVGASEGTRSGEQSSGKN